ncbi:unnamed protein product [Caenorhabditis angaria]|uniref:Uncharacterized protein n=1 Tax=Caenorhabditis angaria TaxID=860376 RepID=A0A9P1N4E1_9PELO|nr:unnamed protein product [Caenorhabditis angaria]
MRANKKEGGGRNWAEPRASGLTTERAQEENRREEENSSCCVSILKITCTKMFLCCCWPIQKLVKLLSCFDSLVIAIFAYNCIDTFMDTINNLHWTTIFSTFFFTFFLVCQLLATVLIFRAASKNIARYCLPRLVLIGGLAICSFAAIVFLIYYFAKGSTQLNEMLYSIIEYFTDEKLEDLERNEYKHQLRYYGVGFLVLASTYFMYNIFQLWLTFKFQSTLNDFEAVSTEPTAPQQSYNPDFGAPPTKYYPNDA